MLADSLAAVGLGVLHVNALAEPILAAPSPPSLAGLAIGWLLLLFMLASASVWPAVVALILRRRLPPDPRLETVLDPVAFGHSPRVLRAPRHAVSSHRSLVTSVCVIGLGLVLMAWAAASRSLGSGGLVVAILFVLPTLLVALHARRRTGPSGPPPPRPASTRAPQSPPPRSETS
jgi:hypothetical protein